MTTRIGLAGVPTSAGSHNPGQEDAPAAWRAAGLPGALEAAGVDVRDYGDLTPRPFRPGRPSAVSVTSAGLSRCARKPRPLSRTSARTAGARSSWEGTAQ
jgi:arginase family enzyme